MREDAWGFSYFYSFKADDSFSFMRYFTKSANHKGSIDYSFPDIETRKSLKKQMSAKGFKFQSSASIYSGATSLYVWDDIVIILKIYKGKPGEKKQYAIALDF